MEKLLWQIIEESKEGKEYCLPDKQFLNLSRILMGYDKDTILSLEKLWIEKLESFKVPEFDLLHSSKGGIVNAGDDGFYLDFRSWLLGQGYDLYQNFIVRKHVAVLEYVAKNQVHKNDLRFESLWYAFSSALEKIETGTEFTIGEIRSVITLSSGKYKVTELRVQDQKVGYRVIFNVERISNGAKTLWAFDIPLDILNDLDDYMIPPEERDLLDKVSKLRCLDLVPHGDIFISEKGLQTGIEAISLKGQGYAASFVIGGVSGRI
ncbi:DUF4240 domain-containing protein [Paenibacillus gallinarum]|uniref:DUF4240 domain-containing protein n=1 Tax=Paenibacillus gallinarum TaxID=2762232 RepID=A0ABR8T4Y9_9BACL|nr:DUF4240 domain-containing protein [Paenibacillus gallinarum]MBD7970364.1 DUF4240 domain-containing protein [Paenibacillus gallinarum]